MPSGGLGLAIARRLACESYRLVCLGRTETPELGALMEEKPDQVVWRRYDLHDLDGLSNFVSSVVRDFGPLYALVNNAAIGLGGLLATQHASEISQMLRVDLEAPVLLAKYACRSMLVRGEGRIVSVTSIIASTGFSGLSVYGATKVGLEGFSRSLSRELGRARITVNCIAPGYMETDMIAGLQGEKLDSVRRRAPLGLPAPEDVAGAVSYLLSADAAMMTGAVMAIDGGSTA